MGVLNKKPSAPIGNRRLKVRGFAPSDCGSLAFLNFFRQNRNEIKQILHHTHVCHLQDRCFGVLVDSHDKGIALEPAHMLEGPADPQCQVNLGFDRLTGSPDLTGFFQPFGIHDRSRA